MKNIFKNNPENINNAISVLKSGGNVVIPTETVYGLAGIGNNDKAIAGIYNIKNRPQFNPLIAHCCDLEMIKQIAVLDQVAQGLLNHFNRGNLTVVLPRLDGTELSKLGCAGLDTVAVRIPNHETALKIIKGSGFPLFAPSANASGGISPTKAEHSYDSLGEAVEMIIDGGDCKCGLESTIIDLTGEVSILRAGIVTKDELEKYFGETIGEKTFAKGNNPIAPGQLKSHYKPNKKLSINVEKPNDKQCYIGYGNFKSDFVNLSENADLLETATNLFDALHKADKSDYDEIAVAPIPNTGIGIAINDKLQRASTEE